MLTMSPLATQAHAVFHTRILTRQHRQRMDISKLQEEKQARRQNKTRPTRHNYLRDQRGITIYTATHDQSWTTSSGDTVFPNPPASASSMNHLCSPANLQEEKAESLLIQVERANV